VTVPQVLRELQHLLLCWAGLCPVCGRPLAAEPPQLSREGGSALHDERKDQDPERMIEAIGHACCQR